MISYDMIVFDMLWQDQIHLLDMFQTYSQKASRGEHLVFPTSFADLWGMFWHHPWCLGAGQKFKKVDQKSTKIKSFSEAPESLENSFALLIKFRALFSH